MYIGINKFSASASDHKPLRIASYSEFNRKLPIYASYITLHEYFKFNVYVSQFYFN